VNVTATTYPRRRGRSTAGPAWLVLLILILIPCAFAATGCRPPAPAGRGRAGDRVTLEITGHTLRVEVSCDDLSRKRGLMYRNEMPDDEGMLFIFPQAKALGFWMKNTEIPLSIAFLSDDGKILQIEDMRPKDLTSTRSMMMVRYALEVNQGWFARHGVKVGDTFTGFRSTVERFDAY